ncbi:MAG: peptidoglycan DD-metalloendopeptidase family protein [Candidatus Hydrogenedentes bacterium]|nr:peptidoglycan DD-metalloendopeptidase family protein [Candidatus Hydrogenedentota bacterium]
MQSRLWRVIRWAPFVLMALSVFTLIGMMLSGGMVKIAGWYLLQLIPPVLGMLTFVAVAIYAAVRRRLTKPILATGIVSLLCVGPVALGLGIVAYPASLEDTEPSATVRLPADGPIRVGWGGDSVGINYHAMAPDQRWAYDLLIEPYLSGSSKLEDYGCYGTPVVAPISGKIIAAHDGEPDATPGVSSNNYTKPLGNHVAILLDTNTYLIIAHLKNGSVAVKNGDVVTEGQFLGECGNSGNTSEPHIHIHHQRQDPNVFPVSFAEGLPLYFRGHDGKPMPTGGLREEGGIIIATGDVIQQLTK